MSIVELDKITIYGATGQKEAALDALQGLGCAHLVDLKRSQPQHPSQFISTKARVALRDLMSCAIQRNAVDSSDGFSLDAVIEEVLTIKEEREKRVSEFDNLRKAITELEPWGDYELPAAKEVGVTFWFYVVRLNELDEFRKDVLWHVANRDSQFAYLVVLSETEPTGLPGTPVELDPRPVKTLLRRLAEVKRELDELQWRRATLTRWTGLIQRELNAADDRAARSTAADRAFDNQSLFAIQGWVPRSACGEVVLMTDRLGLALTVESASNEDRPPTLLHNPERVAGAEGCVTFYITPGYHAWDPTAVVYFSFSLFFAMIVADAGYGLAMLGIVFFLWKGLNKSRASVRFRNLMLAIATATIVYGVLVGSYFGIAPEVDSLLDKLRLKVNGQGIMEDRDLMMVVSVAIGVVHLALANCISAWKTRDSSRCIGHLGWALILIGAFAVGTGTLRDAAGLTQIGWVVLCLGAAGVLFFSSDVPLITWSIKAHAKRMLDGIMQIPNVSKAFGDTLSYLRLFALGLASSQLAVTFNGMAADAFDTKGLGILLAILILSFGHGINFVLGLMGGVVHGLRLNCIEFFNWSLTEEGFPFQPFKKKVGS